ncbi:hypothetical protein EVAR_27228_1 [Eumeta japonica]|uniref:Uncharacterized protein n=1 Tax=Eumeta variegata TaxID=151549 RepID=A0A4C1VYI3_EUMVA|nr:hypothetical protein EVAR_27228_1 [Eumeta japonica]
MTACPSFAADGRPWPREAERAGRGPSPRICSGRTITPRPFLDTDFKRGRTNLADDMREGRFSMATTEDKISHVRLMIE